MFIEPMQGIDAIGGLQQLGQTQKTNESSEGGMFQSVLADSIANVRETEAAVAADTLALATGETNDLHSLGINTAKAQLSISLLVQLRNGFLDAYNEMMRMSV